MPIPRLQLVWHSPPPSQICLTWLVHHPLTLCLTWHQNTR